MKSTFSTTLNAINTLPPHVGKFTDKVYKKRGAHGVFMVKNSLEKIHNYVI